MVSMGSECVSTLHRPRSLSKLVGICRVIGVIANVTGSRAARDIGHARIVKSRVDLALSQYFVASNSPGILEENNAVSPEVVGD